MVPELAIKLAVALAIGLLIGIERGWVERQEAEGERSFGLRTLALSGLLGGCWGAIAVQVPNGGGLGLAIAFAAFAAIAAVYRGRENAHDGTYGTTTVVAAMLAFSLGALAVIGETGVAAAAAVAVTALLAFKGVLHGWLRRLTFEELRSGLILLAMTVIMLPVLPDRGHGPYGAINPRELWLLTIMIAVLSAAGYVALRTGGRLGLLLSGIAGGLVSSTAVTLSFSRLAAERPERLRPLVAGAVLAGTTMLLRVLLIVGALSLPLMAEIVAPLGIAAVTTGAYGTWLGLAGDSPGEGEDVALTSPFELVETLRLAALLALVFVASAIAIRYVGPTGLILVAALSGIADVDAITLSATRQSGVTVSHATAASAVLVAAGVNTLAKLVIAWSAGGRRVGTTYGFAALLVAVGFAAGLWLNRWAD